MTETVNRILAAVLIKSFQGGVYIWWLCTIPSGGHYPHLPDQRRTEHAQIGGLPGHGGVALDKHHIQSQSDASHHHPCPLRQGPRQK